MLLTKPARPFCLPESGYKARSPNVTLGVFEAPVCLPQTLPITTNTRRMTRAPCVMLALMCDLSSGYPRCVMRRDGMCILQSAGSVELFTLWTTSYSATSFWSIRPHEVLGSQSLRILLALEACVGRPNGELRETEGANQVGVPLKLKHITAVLK